MNICACAYFIISGSICGRQCWTTFSGPMAIGGEECLNSQKRQNQKFMNDTFCAEFIWDKAYEILNAESLDTVYALQLDSGSAPAGFPQLLSEDIQLWVARTTPPSCATTRRIAAAAATVTSRRARRACRWLVHFGNLGHIFSVCQSSHFFENCEALPLPNGRYWIQKLWIFIGKMR